MDGSSLARLPHCRRRGRPRFTGDPGVFLTVAGRVLDGYRLTRASRQQEDPLFFYEYALALWVGGWRAPSLLDAVWLSIGMVSMGYLLRLMGLPTRVQVTTAVAFALSPTGPWYYAGFSMLPSLALAPLPAALWLRERHVAAGAVLSLAVLLKLNVALVVATPLLVLLLLAPKAHRINKRGGIRLILGLAVPAVARVVGNARTG